MAARTIATCSAALGPEQCVLSSNHSRSEPPAHWYAVVHYGAEGEARLIIDLYARGPEGSRIASSELEFKAQDSAEERWASAGVVVAALVLAQPLDRQQTEEPPAKVTVAVAEPVASAPRARAAPWLRLDLGITAGSEMRNAPLRVGPFGRFGIAFANVPLFAFASGAYTVQNGESTDLSWLTGSLGAGFRVGFARQRAALELRTELVLETVGIHASDGERSESARRTRFGPRFGLDVSGHWAKNWALVVGGEAGALGPRVVIDVLGETAELPPFVWGFLSAVRYDFR